MPEFKCPRCNTTLREDDSCVYEAPIWMGPYLRVQIQCWQCTWLGQWFAANVIMAPEVELPA